MWPQTRSGVSPIVGTVILLGIVTALAGSVVVFLQQTQSSIIGGTEKPQLETINVTCQPDRITWWLANTGKHDVTNEVADLFIYDDAGLNTKLSLTQVTLEGAFLTAGQNGSAVFTPGDTLSIGATYDLELDLQQVDVGASCTVGSDWWNINWDHRRALTTPADTAITANLSLNAATLIRNGDLRADCADIRVVHNGEPAFHEITKCDQNGEAWVLANLSGIAVGDTYLYHGNLQARDTSTTLNPLATPPQQIPLGPQENISLPG